MGSKDGVVLIGICLLNSFMIAGVVVGWPSISAVLKVGTSQCKAERWRYGNDDVHGNLHLFSYLFRVRDSLTSCVLKRALTVGVYSRMIRIMMAVELMRTTTSDHISASNKRRCSCPLLK